MFGLPNAGLYSFCAQNQAVSTLFFCLKPPIQWLGFTGLAAFYYALKCERFDPRNRVTVL